MKRPLAALVWLVTAWNKSRWEMSLLSVPFVRALFYVAHLAPAQLNDEIVARHWQMIALCLLGASSLIAGVGVLGERPIVERFGLQLLGSLSVIYACAAVASNPANGSVTFTVYMIIAACCFTRGREITKAMRIVNRRYQEATLNDSATR